VPMMGRYYMDKRTGVKFFKKQIPTFRNLRLLRCFLSTHTKNLIS